MSFMISNHGKVGGMLLLQHKSYHISYFLSPGCAADLLWIIFKCKTLKNWWPSPQVLQYDGTLHLCPRTREHSFCGFHQLWGIDEEFLIEIPKEQQVNSVYQTILIQGFSRFLEESTTLTDKHKKRRVSSRLFHLLYIPVDTLQTIVGLILTRLLFPEILSQCNPHDSF